MLESMTLILVIITSFILSVFIYLNNPRSATNTLFGLMSLFIVFWATIMYLTLQDFNPEPLLFLIRLSMLAAILMSTGILLFSINFPSEKFVISKKTLFPLLILATLGMLTAISPLMFTGLTIENDNVITIAGPGMIMFFITGLGYSISGIIVFLKKFLHSKGLVRLQLKYMLIGLITMHVLLIWANFLVVIFFKSSAFINFGPLFALIFLITTAYAVFRHRLFDIRFLLIRSVAFITVMISLIFLYSVGLQAMMLLSPPNYHFILSVVTLVIVVFTFNPLSRTIARITEFLFQKKFYNPANLLQNLGLITNSTLSIENLMEKIILELNSTMHVGSAIFIASHNSQKYFFQKNFGGIDIKIDQNFLHKIIPKLSGNPIVFEELPESKTKDVMRQANLAVIIPLEFKNQVVGSLLLGSKLSGEIYTNQDLQVIEILAYQLSIAINNSLAYEEIKSFNNTLKDEVNKATSKLKVANSRLKELDTLKDEFVSIASHELRTPLTSIRNYQWMLLNGKGGQITEKQRYYLERSYRATGRLTKLVTDMLNVSRIDSGRILVTPEEVDIFELTNEIIEELQVKIKERKISVHHQRPHQKLPKVVIDRDKIYEVMTNLLGNALKFTPPKGSIDISYVHQGDFITWSIEDNGIGIDPKYLNELFTKFGFVKNSIRSNHPNTESTGLGLYISKAIIKMHGGNIWAKSAGINQGSTFAFSVPIYTAKLFKSMQNQYSKDKDAGLLHNPID